MTKQLAGQRFGRLVAVSAASVSGRRGWACKCDCGGSANVMTSNLCGGKVISCGCAQKEAAQRSRTTHGKSKTRTYRIWRNMNNRCHYEKWPEWHLYGGRGIAVCGEWRASFEVFLRDMGEAPESCSIDRIDNGAGYSKANCRWATAIQQANNRRKPNAQAFAAQHLEQA